MAKAIGISVDSVAAHLTGAQTSAAPAAHFQ